MCNEGELGHGEYSAHPVRPFDNLRFGGVDATELEQRILRFADVMLEHLRARGVDTLQQALELILSAELSLGENDADLMMEPCLRG